MPLLGSQRPGLHGKVRLRLRGDSKPEALVQLASRVRTKNAELDHLSLSCSLSQYIADDRGTKAVGSVAGSDVDASEYHFLSVVLDMEHADIPVLAADDLLLVWNETGSEALLLVVWIPSPQLFNVWA